MLIECTQNVKYEIAMNVIFPLIKITLVVLRNKLK